MHFDLYIGHLNVDLKLLGLGMVNRWVGQDISKIQTASNQSCNVKVSQSQLIIALFESHES